MYLRIGSKILNTYNMTDADVYEPGQELTPYGGGSSAADTLTIVITTTAVESSEDGTLGARRIVLEGEDADALLAALPVYAPVLEETCAGRSTVSLSKASRSCSRGTVGGSGRRRVLVHKLGHPGGDDDRVSDDPFVDG